MFSLGRAFTTPRAVTNANEKARNGTFLNRCFVRDVLIRNQGEKPSLAFQLNLQSTLLRSGNNVSRDMHRTIPVPGPLARRTHDGRRLQPFCSSGRTARTVAVPPVTGVLIRARKVPETRPARYSAVVLAGAAIVVNASQTIAPPDPDPGTGAA
jgi:hypothetical protein